MRTIDADAFWKPFEEEKEELENRTIKTSSALTALKFIDFIKRRLDIQPTILQPQWIPCSERLPERGTSILMASRQGWIAEGEYKGVLDGCHLWIEYRWSASLTNGEIIAWMPLPKAYGGESDETN